MTKIKLSVMLLFLTASTHGQTLNYLNVLCGSINPAILISDADGNFYAAGMMNSGMDFDPGPAVNAVTMGSRTKMYVAKYNSLGAYQWAFGVEIGNSSPSPEAYPIAMAVDNSGSVYITGIFSHNGCDMDPGPAFAPISLNTGPAYSTAYFYAKYSSTGQYIYAYSFGQRVRVSDLVVDQFANVYLTGCATGADMDPGPNVVSMPVQGSVDRFLMKLDSSANFVWAKIFNSTGGGECISKITFDNNFDLVIGGKVGLNHDFDAGSGTFFLGPHDIYIAKYDSSGDFIWAIPLSYFNSYINSIKVDNNNNILIAGPLLGINNDFDPDSTSVLYLNSNGSHDSYVAKYTPTGNLIWAFSIGHTESDYLYDMDLDSGGNVYITGTFDSDTMDFDPSSSTFYLSHPDPNYQANYTAVYDSTGAFITAFLITGFSSPKGAQNTIINGNELVMAGVFTTLPYPVDFDPGPGVVGSGICAGGGFITKYGTGFVEVAEWHSAPDFDIYPNPSNDQINIRFEVDHPKELSISLIDMTGRIYRSLYKGNSTTGLNTMTFSVSELPKGIYLIKFDSENGQKVQKLVVL